ncbi:MAG TPA: hypothetical protein VIH61_10355 [Waddliaceae bacterium]
MLRFTPSIALHFRQRDSLFSYTFWKGFGIAFCLHLSLFIVFRIASLPNLDIHELLPPVTVETDLSSTEIRVLPTTQFLYFPMEVQDPPYLDSYEPYLQVKKDLYPLKKITIPEPDFSELEKIDYEPFPEY